MQPVEDRPPGSRKIWHCTCGFGIEAVRLPAVGRGGQGMTAYFAREVSDGVPAGRRITRCPRCGKRFAWITWERFLELCGAGFGP